MSIHDFQALLAGNAINASLAAAAIVSGDQVTLGIVLLSWACAYAAAVLGPRRLYLTAIGLKFHAGLFWACTGATIAATIRIVFGIM